MRSVRLAALVAAGCLVWGTASMTAGQVPGERVAPQGDESPFFRVFLKDGSSLVSYGELARLSDRIVFSMPTTSSPVEPQLHLVTLSSDRVDWERTNRYADAARATRYIAIRAEQDYALLTDEVAQALNDVSQAPNAAGRLAVVERARKTLAEWPARHYNYKQNEVRQMLGTLDEAIADLRAAAGLSRFDLNFVAATEAPDYREPLMPHPSPREAIEQTLLAARLTESSVERVSLLTTVLGSLDREAAALESKWAAATKVATQSAIASEMTVDRLYQTLTQRYVAYAETRAKRGDVRGVQNILAQIPIEDRTLGGRRPEAVASLVAAVQDQLDAAQRMRLARDRWLLKSEEYKKYGAAVTPQLQKLQGLKPALEDIKALSGSTPLALSQIQSSSDQILRAVTAIIAPEDLRAAHALVISAAQLADSAARIRREAALSGSIDRAWDASSAAAGALMLVTRAAAEIDAMMKPPVPIR